ncbi:MAG: aldolase/citrate lyase family protein [Candidatus Omnitrophica bacterium]|nr:aldolase/citrate lyase family protein [Candidatus Omnitrophota bacterium]
MEIAMRKSRVLRKLRNNEIALSTKINLTDPVSVELAALAGFDCVWLDMEHTPSDWSAICDMIRTAKIYDMDAMVRVSKGSYSDLIKPLEADATGIIYPHLMSLEEAKQLVYFTRFHPIGRRPLDSGNADGKYCQIDMKDYVRQANEERFVMVQIEDPEVLPDIEKIAQLDGIDIIFFGPGDFSQGIGATGDFNHPLLVETRKKVAQVCKKYGNYCATPCGIQQLKEYIEMGYNFLNLGADVLGLGSYWKNLLDEAKKILSEYKKTGG